ncbi:unnamed protein product [Clonostachys rosea f. rosea IK726]|uniref:Uncharacterized protein n=1 Tax=Clonostachys rosea f. rosea IK726 TaxID=1349383 RepID=A0ACA9ULC0_BIOOC|nr:unnamed protein product [Clonostachys rosea f. rosea IK726]
MFDKEVKKTFRGKSNEEFFINFPIAGLEDDTEAGLELNTWRMTGGAALSQLDAAVIVSTISTKHYGVEAWSMTETAEDHKQPTTKWRDGTTRVLKMTWYIAIGEDISRDQKIRFRFYRVLDVNYKNEDLNFEDVLYDCSDL